jgi:hypothetical protein
MTARSDDIQCENAKAENALSASNVIGRTFLNVACHTPFVSFSLVRLQPLLKLVMHSNLQAHQRRSTDLVRKAA